MRRHEHGCIVAFYFSVCVHVRVHVHAWTPLASLLRVVMLACLADVLLSYVVLMLCSC